MAKQKPEFQSFSARLAQGPAFLILGSASNSTASPRTIEYRWSGIYTSQLEKRAAEQFRTGWRTVQSLAAMSSTPSRSQTDLEVRFLFGAHHLPETDQPPTDPLKEADARVRCVQEISRLATETVTPRGVIVIENWSPDEMLDVRDLVPPLRQLSTAQIHLFSAAVWSRDPFVESLVKNGQLVIHSESLEETLGHLNDSGLLSGNRNSQSSSNLLHVIALGESFRDIDVHTWNQIRRSARPIDLELLSPPLLGSSAARYKEFREFVSAPDSAPRWRGISAGMNVRREFEDTLSTQINKALNEKEFPKPIIVSGQTATGKSVALAAVAMELARNGTVAVLHQSRRGARPISDDIEMYAVWAEEHGAATTVLIWDGMVEPSEYESLARQLRNRGRKILVVGSTYVTKNTGQHIIQAPAELTRAETAQLLKLLNSFGVEFKLPMSGLDTSFLAFLYHALPETEYGLRSGLAFEMRAAEKGIEKLVAARGTTATTSDRISAMAAALQAAGYSPSGHQMSAGDDEKPLLDQSFAERDAIQRVTTLVLVSGRHGTSVPIDLALRILGQQGSTSIRDALNSFDIIRELNDDDGEYFLTIRSRLEAELLMQQDVSLDTEIEVFCEIIRNIRIQSGYVSGPDEVQFLVSLLERIGPNSLLGNRYKQYFGTITDALRNRRELDGRPHPRLVLQESVFTRSEVRQRHDSTEGSSFDWLSALENNRYLLDEVLGDTSLSLMMRSSLTVELASTLAASMREGVKNGSPGSLETLRTQLDDILTAVLSARTIDPGNLYPIDVLAWSTRDAVQSLSLSPSERLDRLANAVATIESVDRSSLTDKQLALIDRRSTELNRLLKEDDAVWESIRNLEQNADPAATYFLSKLEAETGPQGEAAALKRLRNAPRPTRLDWRCSQLLLELTWKDLTGHRLLQGQRVGVNLSERARVTLLDLCKDLNDSDITDRYKLLFVQALVQFESGNYSDASKLFRDVENLTRQLSKRIYTTIFLADDEGQPEIFTGRVVSSNSRNGEVWVHELSTIIRFDPHLFSTTQQFAQNQSLPAFVIGFKLSRGPVAEPRSMYRESRQ